ncbi:hypothetical protein B7C42_08273 [Nocardia cerradoensis]|uniref:DUF3039 domain-containing protein n=1 Tax=Nocardia cerradoensis TaxID=85688 RepID=A0A231GSU8_9NOCA|nr:DUF3039 domain-containing protein [Nocardia cerradoensis]OXR39658.1 hypothetical protein B7C42_08273 [Nocardia cerradoensis]
MEHNRRARPTIRLLSEDLPSGWEDPNCTRAIADRQWDRLRPLAELPHPLLRKAAEMYGPDPVHDPAPRPIERLGSFRLQELRNSQWRAGIWTDPETGVRWIVAAGLAKGGHQDGDDFYKTLERRVGNEGGASSMLPTARDVELLKTETAAWALTSWYLEIQTRITQALKDIRAIGCIRVDLPPSPRRQSSTIGQVEIDFEAISDDETPREEFTVTFRLDAAHLTSNWGWRAIQRVLISIAPPVQDWDRHQNIAFVMGDPGHLDRQLRHLSVANEQSVLLAAEHGAVSHYTHAPHIAEASVTGTALRAMCGVVFVPTRDPDRFPVCARCEEEYAALSR